MAALREEAVGLREALEAQRTTLERHYAGLNAKLRKECEQVTYRHRLCTGVWWPLAQKLQHFQLIQRL